MIMTDGPGEWVDRTSFVMPAIPEEMGIDPILAGLLHQGAFLELSEDEAVDPDGAVEAMEHVAAYVQQPDPAAAREIQHDLDRIADYGRGNVWSEELLEYIREFLRNCGVGEEEK